MPRFSIFLVEYVGGILRPQVGISNAFLQPFVTLNSPYPSSKTPDSDSIILNQSIDNPGMWFADISNPAPRYDLYINSLKQNDFSGTGGFNLASSKSLFIKQNIEINSNAWQTPEIFIVGEGKLATPDGGQTWPNLVNCIPAVYCFPPSVQLGSSYVWRQVRLVKDSWAYTVDNKLLFQLSLDPNGPDLSNYYFDLMLVLL